MILSEKSTQGVNYNAYCSVPYESQYNTSMYDIYIK